MIIASQGTIISKIINSCNTKQCKYVGAQYIESVWWGFGINELMMVMRMI